MAIVGGGYIGVELATVFSKLGVRVTVIEKAQRILPEMDEALARVVAQALVDRGVTVVAEASSVRATDKGARYPSTGQISRYVLTRLWSRSVVARIPTRLAWSISASRLAGPGISMFTRVALQARACSQSET